MGGVDRSYAVPPCQPARQSDTTWMPVAAHAPAWMHHVGYGSFVLKRSVIHLKTYVICFMSPCNLSIDNYDYPYYGMS